ncbi:cobyrinate a,c-diamide synthase [Rhodococcus coprophilus]|uniref:Hydrogenobyrinate a,c-diamide synthase n=1 Tax=Rhodococcus coprophilus TaxID=38310 RepID=A0A2X4UTZ2_9NOCA|nr:cobyrinate a,c-diamide synthase [Rhodococcus coprophilus]MBM7459557.1 cobyrinic acid a,c-diamide synthase [Rhodococcus coprophilus]SQI36480.1 cobyrinate-a,c-diamine synthase cobb [Rhodococcus coprophilus]
MVALPRLVVAAPASGHGKTTVSAGLMAALRRTGMVVSGHKIGPDYIDPGYHALATGRPGRNLDPHLVGEDLVAPLLLHGAAGADIAVVEGVMGLYDGMLGTDGYASTSHVASLLTAPVILVVDVSHASRSIAAIVHGMASYDRGTRIAGVILNKAGSQRHSDEVIAALEPTGIPVLGALHRDDGISAPSRHLGLIPAEERAEAAGQLDRLADAIAEHIDLAELVRIARTVPDMHSLSWEPGEPVSHSDVRPVVAIAGGRAFTFRYTETEELLRAAGCRTVTFDPLRDEKLPDGTTGIYLGGGFPEVHAADLSANVPLRDHLRAAITAGVPTVAECAGLLYLCRDVDGAEMVGALDASARMTSRLTLGYRTAIATTDSLLATAGTRVTGHEFHRTVAEPGPAPGWLLDGRPDGFATATLHASYLHTHWAGHPQLAQRFVDAARAATPVPAPPPQRRLRAPDLHHHGDREATPGLVDLAVNVSKRPRPAWLDDALRASLHDLDRYPDPEAACSALASRHGRTADEILPTAGGAEAFTLIARAREWHAPVVVHPQFTEPEAALAAAGHDVRRVILRAGDGFVLDPGAVPDDADLVVIGNPTNPTSVLHPAGTLRALLRPGRVVVVDEAFMDAVPGETESLAGERQSGLVVVRSLTKTWAIPGIRSGYVVGAADVIVDLAAQQPPWSVSTPAAAAMIACAAARATSEAETIAREIAADRAALVEALKDSGLTVAGTPAGPFVLVPVRAGTREKLRARGFAVRRGDTFPGLGEKWVRIAVRDRATTAALLDAWRSIR